MYHKSLSRNQFINESQIIKIVYQQNMIGIWMVLY